MLVDYWQKNVLVYLFKHNMLVYDVNQYMMKPPIYHPTRLIAILSPAVLANHSCKNAHISLNMKPFWLTLIGTQQQRAW